jgi:hypothetical protein
MESVVLKQVKHNIFDSIEEFEEYFMVNEGVVPELKYEWREGGVGDWVVSDDGRIVQILSRKEYSEKRRKRTGVFIRTIVGTFELRGKMDTDLTVRVYPQGRYRIRKLYLHWRVVQAHRVKLSSKEKQYIARLFNGEDRIAAYYDVYGCIYMKAADKKSKNLLKQPRIIGAILGKTPKELAEELGVGIEAQLKKYKLLLDKEEDTEKILKILKELGDVVDIKEERKKGLLPFDSGFMQIKAASRRELLGMPGGDDE